MKLSFHGAAQTVTGSKFVLELNNGKNLLLDCGLFQGSGKKSDALNRQWGFEPSKVYALILSHAHIDHCGLIPKLVADGFKGKIYCTPATKDLAELLLLDSARIQHNDLLYMNKKRERQGKPLLSPLYNEKQVIESLKKFETKPFNKSFSVTENVQVLFTDAGHIAGSAVVNLEIVLKRKNKTYLTYSG
ncbi:MAG: MBL fold metallo-hydrolase, partial [Chitinophagales bacterium]|nr:MBL fold metallo-hydrolase [Chitinophagales bacterium]